MRSAFYAHSLQILAFVLVLLFSHQCFAKNKSAVISAHPLATKAGESILKQGGSAADAAIAMAFVLAVTEPQNSGLGGGGILVYYQKNRNRFAVVDYLSIGPFAASEVDYKKKLAKTGPKAAGVPGFVLGMQKIHKAFGKLAWHPLLQNAIEHAQQGFTIPKTLLADIKSHQERLKDQKGFNRVFSPLLNQKKPFLVQPELAQTLKTIQKKGASTFYQGSFTPLFDDLKRADTLLTKEDFERYKVLFRKPHQFFFLDNIIVTPGVPSVGGLFLNKLLNTAHQKKISPDSAKMTKFIESETETFYNQNKSLLDSKENILGHTTHLVVLDKDGNIASMSNTLHDPFGSGVYLQNTGILMNNVVDDYNFDSEEVSLEFKRRHRPLTHLTPTILFKGFKAHLALGTSGGKTIPQNLFQILYPYLTHQLPLKKLLREPKFYSFPQAKTAFVEQGFDTKKRLHKALKVVPRISQTSAGNTQILSIDITKVNRLKVITDSSRGNGTGKIF